MIIAATDEVGRGALFGPVVAAAVIMNPDLPVKGLKDSKKLSSLQRDRLAEKIKESALAWSTSEISAKVVDEVNVLQASLMAMKRAVESLNIEPDLVQVDGVHLPDWRYHGIAIAKGDEKIDSISAASIIAKVHRDRIMDKFHERYPYYGFDKHRGYATVMHLHMLKTYGPLYHHRRTFKPVVSLKYG